MNVNQAPASDQGWSNLTPQQKMGLALLQASQSDIGNYQQNGQFSPMQGMAGMSNALLAGQMMNQGGAGKAQQLPQVNYNALDISPMSQHGVPTAGGQ